MISYWAKSAHWRVNQESHGASLGESLDYHCCRSHVSVVRSSLRKLGHGLDGETFEARAERISIIFALTSLSIWRER